MLAIGADFSAANARNAIFDSARLQGAVFNGALLTNASFKGASLNGATFQDARLAGADFTNAKDISQADFSGACISDNQMPIGLILPDCSPVAITSGELFASGHE
jgi:uncharacterized protein YjbI with pentapeptide repeats